MNHAVLPKFANPHSSSQGYERTSRAEHTKHTEVLAENVQDDSTDTLKRKLDDLLHETWSNLPQSGQAPENVAGSPNRNKRSKPENQNLPVGPDDGGQVLFRLLSSVNNPRTISLRPKPPQPILTMEPEWEDCTEKAEERRQRALSVAVEFDGQWCAWGSSQLKPPATEQRVRVTGCTISLPWPSVLVTEEIRLPSRMRSVPTHLQNAETLQTHGVTRPSPHEIKTSCVPIVPVQTIAHSSTTTPRSSRRRRRRKQVQKKPLPAYWRAPSDMRGKCMGYAMGYPGSWRYSGTPATAYVRDTMKRGVNA